MVRMAAQRPAPPGGQGGCGSGGGTLAAAGRVWCGGWCQGEGTGVVAEHSGLLDPHALHDAAVAGTCRRGQVPATASQIDWFSEDIAEIDSKGGAGGGEAASGHARVMADPRAAPPLEVSATGSAQQQAESQQQPCSMQPYKPDSEVLMASCECWLAAVRAPPPQLARARALHAEPPPPPPPHPTHTPTQPLARQSFWSAGRTRCAPAACACSATRTLPPPWTGWSWPSCLTPQRACWLAAPT